MSKLFVMWGPPGSGKSTYAEQVAINEDAYLLSSDALRLEMFGDEMYQGNNFKLFQEMRERARSMLDSGVNVVYDATNLSAGRRIALLNYLKPDEAYIFCMTTPVNECIERDIQRGKSGGRRVGRRVIYRMANNMELPTVDEGWTDIYLV